MQVVIGYTYIVASGSLFLFNWIEGWFCHHGRLYAVSFETASRDTQPSTYMYREMWANFMRDKLGVMTEQQSQNLLLKVRPALYYTEQVYHSRWKIGNLDSEGESFCIEYIVTAFKAAIK